eukprot:CAMPEP_0117509560 /NCGR_PEP_ID=MMETSP0784-20121206/27538_1 /TAXON_ID=39447 /ORGANISM="" /LENGTH=52 /DNA_ID=CAMNT_0005305171 /DNA_START=34 /DNA_END=192 /DNA_ORIENTATION=-
MKPLTLYMIPGIIAIGARGAHESGMPCMLLSRVAHKLTRRRGHRREVDAAQR